MDPTDFTGEGVYGLTAVRGEGPGRLDGLKVAGGGGKASPPPTPANGQAGAPVSLGGLLDDPTFWLVATIGTAAYLAWWSAQP